MYAFGRLFGINTKEIYIVFKVLSVHAFPEN